MWNDDSEKFIKSYMNNCLIENICELDNENKNIYNIFKQ